MSVKLFLALVPVTTLAIGSLTLGSGPGGVPLAQVEQVASHIPGSLPSNVADQLADVTTAQNYRVYLYDNFRIATVYRDGNYRDGNYRYPGYSYGSYRYVSNRYYISPYSTSQYGDYRYGSYGYGAYRSSGYDYRGYRYR